PHTSMLFSLSLHDALPILGDRCILVTFRANACHVRHGTEIRAAEITGAVRKIAVERLYRLVQIAQECQLHAVRSDVSHLQGHVLDRKSTRLNSSHVAISYA